MNLDTTIDIDLQKFFHWWGKELAFLVPKTLRQKLRENQGRVVFTPIAQGFELAFLDDEGQLIVQRQMDLTENAYQQLKQQYPLLERAEIVLRLAPQQALQRLVYFPVAVQENLQQVVSFELDRYTPFNAEQVYFNVLPLDQTGHGQIRVLLIVVPKNQLDEQLTLLESMDIRPHRVDYQSTIEHFPQTENAYNLLPDRFRQQGSGLSRSAHWLLGGLTALLILAVLIWPVWLEAQAVDSLKARIKELEKQNRVVDARQREIDALHDETQKLIDIKRHSPALLPVLNELSKLLNDETWLTHFRFSGQHMQIQGQSPAASALIGVLEASEFFSDVSFVSPLTQDKSTGRERFQISMEISVPIAALSAGNKPKRGRDRAGFDATDPADVSEIDTVEGEEIGE